MASGFGTLLRSKTNIEGAAVFAYPVNDPERYGVVEFDANNKVSEYRGKTSKSKIIITQFQVFIFMTIKCCRICKKSKTISKGRKRDHYFKPNVLR